ncbi:YbjN domain-containing protein [Streptomyces sp. NPDC057509]|uniref:YbjN domain-containing protein n=1 Tax=Streptomyces sp. NPDC057509 TaxID=3346152 RepID=UPI0036CE3B9C
MSIDPSSIPNFGGQPEPQAAGPEGPVVPDQDLVKQLLDQMELKYVVDDEGDLAAPWEEFRTYFMFRGEGEQQVFSVRTFYDRPHDTDQRPVLLDAIDDWNRRTLWPKVYTHTHEPEEGSEETGASVRLIGEAQMLIGTGVSRSILHRRSSVEVLERTGPFHVKQRLLCCLPYSAMKPVRSRRIAAFGLAPTMVLATSPPW